MKDNNLKQKIQKLLDQSDVQIDGIRPWDIKVNNEQLYERILADGLLAVGDTYMEGWWDCAALDQLIDRILRVKWDFKKILPKKLGWDVLKAKFINQQRKSKAYEIGKRHYDTGNKLFQLMLDKRMNYSCAYWKNTDNPDEAQEAKLALICKKLKIKPMFILVLFVVSYHRLP